MSFFLLFCGVVEGVCDALGFLFGVGDEVRDAANDFIVICVDNLPAGTIVTNFKAYAVFCCGNEGEVGVVYGEPSVTIAETDVDFAVFFVLLHNGAFFVKVIAAPVYIVIFVRFNGFAWSAVAGDAAHEVSHFEWAMLGVCGVGGVYESAGEVKPVVFVEREGFLVFAVAVRDEGEAVAVYVNDFGFYENDVIEVNVCKAGVMAGFCKHGGGGGV